MLLACPRQQSVRKSVQKQKYSNYLKYCRVLKELLDTCSCFIPSKCKKIDIRIRIILVRCRWILCYEVFFLQFDLYVSCDGVYYWIRLEFATHPKWKALSRVCWTCKCNSLVDNTASTHSASFTPFIYTHFGILCCVTPNKKKRRRSKKKK